ncbi:hypothetical protein [Lacinutrix jangbogonensis]|uniref:hypothetical protein n=1 Tax=Lacinutrix jangbogonensis TaxID=1469557 RepID=UPI001F14E867|nr:hypothetical protein [Lacinutrix jangbogonensis]
MYILSFGSLVSQLPPSRLNSYIAMELFVASLALAVTAISCWSAKAKLVTSASITGGSLTVTKVSTGILAHPVALSVAITL